MEVLAMELKLKGCYVARQLSFEGVSFYIDQVPLTDRFKNCYDTSVKVVSALRIHN